MVALGALLAPGPYRFLKKRSLTERKQLATLAQLVEQQTENLRVWSSILRGGITLKGFLKELSIGIAFLALGFYSVKPHEYNLRIELRKARRTNVRKRRQGGRRQGLEAGWKEAVGILNRAVKRRRFPS